MPRFGHANVQLQKLKFWIVSVHEQQPTESFYRTVNIYHTTNEILLESMIFFVLDTEHNWTTRTQSSK